MEQPVAHLVHIQEATGSSPVSATKPERITVRRWSPSSSGPGCCAFTAATPVRTRLGVPSPPGGTGRRAELKPRCLAASGFDLRGGHAYFSGVHMPTCTYVHIYVSTRHCSVAQPVAQSPHKGKVAGSSPAGATSPRSSNGSDPGLWSRRSRFDSSAGILASIAQWSELPTFNRRVPGSSPGGGTLPAKLKWMSGRLLSGWVRVRISSRAPRRRRPVASRIWRGQPRDGGGSDVESRVPFGARGFDPRPFRGRFPSGVL